MLWWSCSGTAGISILIEGQIGASNGRMPFPARRMGMTGTPWRTAAQTSIRQKGSSRLLADSSHNTFSDFATWNQEKKRNIFAEKDSNAPMFMLEAKSSRHERHEEERPALWNFAISCKISLLRLRDCREGRFGYHVGTPLAGW